LALCRASSKLGPFGDFLEDGLSGANFSGTGAIVLVATECIEGFGGAEEGGGPAGNPVDGLVGGEVDAEEGTALTTGDGRSRGAGTGGGAEARPLGSAGSLET